MAALDDPRVQPAFAAMLTDDVAGLENALAADPEIVSLSWGENTLLEWMTQPPGPPNLTIADVLIAAGSPLDRALNLAGCWNLAELCERLLAAGADPAARADAGITPLESAAMHGSIDSADVLVASGLHRPSLWLAAATGQLDRVMSWVAATGNLSAPVATFRPDLAVVGHPPAPPVGDDPESVLGEALVFAGANGRMAVVDYLVEAGVSIDARPYLNTTALHFAIMFRNPAAVRGLLDRGAAVDINDDRHGGDAAGWAHACFDENDPASAEILSLVGGRSA